MTMLQEKSRSLARLRRETELGDICATQRLLRDATRRDFREDLLLIITTFDKALRDTEKNETKEELSFISAIAEELFQ